MRDFDRGSGVLLVLHGHDGDPADARAWGRRLAPPGWEVVAPGAPRDADGVRSWFASGPRGADATDLRAATARLTDTVGRLRSGGSRVVVAGFSQGAALVLVALRHGLDVDAAVALRGFLPEHDDLGGTVAPARPGLPVLVTTGTADDVVPSEFGDAAGELLGVEGFDVTVRADEDGHVAAPDSLDAARDWIAARTGRTVRVSLSLPTDRVTFGTEFVSVDGIADLAAAYERLGFDACYVTDHPAPDTRWLDHGGHHSLDPAVALAVAATSTRHLLLHTHVFVAAYRNPFLAAKTLASLDAVSGGRLVVGVAAGYLRPEFEALGVPFDDRGARLDAALDLMREVWTGADVSGEGDGWRARSVRALPVPAQRPGPPVWVGGNSRPAMRRAVVRGDGWAPFAAPAAMAAATRTAPLETVADLGRRLVLLDELCEETGRPVRPTVCFVPFALADLLAGHDGATERLAEEVTSLAALGVDWITLEVPGTTRAEVLDRATDLAGALGLRP